MPLGNPWLSWAARTSNAVSCPQQWMQREGRRAHGADQSDSVMCVPICRSF